MRSSCWTLVTNAPVRPTAPSTPMRATPSDEPSCCPVYWRPPASPRPDASTDDWTTRPSCEAISPIPTPRTAIDAAKARSLRSGVIVASSMNPATAVVARPALVMDRTAYRLDKRDPIAAARNMAMDVGSIFTPVWRASRPSTSCRYSGIVKKTPIRMRFCEKRPIRPARSGGIFTRSRWTSGSLPVASRRRCHHTKAHRSTAPPAMTNGVSDRPNGVTGESLGAIRPHVLDCRIPRTTAPRPAAARIEPTTSSLAWVPCARRPRRTWS